MIHHHMTCITSKFRCKQTVALWVCLATIALLLFSPALTLADNTDAETAREKQLLQRAQAIQATREKLMKRGKVSNEKLKEVRSELTRILKENQGRNDTGFMFRKPDMEHVAGNRIFEGKPTPVECLAEFSKQLKQQGTDLIVVPLPNQIMVHGHKLFDGIGPGDDLWPAYTQGMIKLLEADVEVIDLLPAFQAYQGEDYVIHKYDHHWGSAGMHLAAEAIAERLQRYDWLKQEQLPAEDFSSRRVDVPMPSELLAHNEIVPYPKWLKGKRVDWVPSQYNAEQILYQDKPLETYPSKRHGHSPVLVMGDSTVFHLSWQHGGRSCGFPEHLSRSLCLIVDQNAKAAGGPQTAKRYVRELVGKKPQPKVIILTLVTSDLVEANWPIPKFPERQNKVDDPPQVKPSNAQFEIIELSHVPDPKQTTYPDAIAVAKVRLVEKEGDTNRQGRERLIAYRVMKNRELLPAAHWKVGNKLQANLIPWEKAVELNTKLDSIQMINTIEDLELDLYWLESASDEPASE